MAKILSINAKNAFRLNRGYFIYISDFSFGSFLHPVSGGNQFYCQVYTEEPEKELFFTGGFNPVLCL